MIRKKGFTLVELNLAMVFVALLLLGVAATTIHISKLYHRGVTIKSVNQVGREVVGQLRDDIAQAQTDGVNTSEIANGRLCLGGATYLLNSAEKLASGSSDVIRPTPPSEPIALVKISNDPNSEWCKRDTSGAFVKSSVIDSALFTSGDATELLRQDEFMPLAIHDLKLEQMNATVEGSSQMLYALSVLIGTNVTDSIEDGQCRPPESNQAYFSDCFVADFATVVRAGEIKQQ